MAAALCSLGCRPSGASSVDAPWVVVVGVARNWVVVVLA